MATYVTIDRDQINADAVWHTPGNQQGQTIYASYAHANARARTEAGPSDHFKRVTDASVPADHPDRERFFALEGATVYRWAAVTAERKIDEIFDHRAQADAYSRTWRHRDLIVWQVWGTASIGDRVDVPQLL